MNFDHLLNFDAETHQSGYIAIIGKPNVGKSTLLNGIIGMKLSITSDKPQTTRNRVIGIYSEEDVQMIFLDTPGIINPRYKLQQTMMNYVEQAQREADVILFMVDATSPDYPDYAFEQLNEFHQPKFLIINKIDMIDQEKVFKLIERYKDRCDWKEIMAVSALKGIGTEGLVELLRKDLPKGPPFYPKEMVSEHPERFFIGEMIREQIFHQFREEIPYSTAVHIISYDESEKIDRIHADIIVDRKSQKGIIIGKGGSAIKKIGVQARKEIEQFLGKQVHIQLFVKVRENWRNNDQQLSNFGYE
jgi:GTP-binding protein Era